VPYACFTTVRDREWICKGIYLGIDKAEIFHCAEEPGYVTDYFRSACKSRRMAYGRCIGKFPHDVLSYERPPLHVVIEERLDMSLQEIGCNRHFQLPPARQLTLNRNSFGPENAESPRVTPNWAPEPRGAHGAALHVLSVN
jgi:hypothetical protein